jgi:DDE superfamily endonuclease
MAIWYFAGGDPLDIADVHMVGEDQPLINVWHVVNAINAVRDLNIKFPSSSHQEQVNIAWGSKAKSTINIDSCVVAMDGILIWIHKPTKAFLDKFRVGPAKFFSGRKGKYGLNMQAVCDANGRCLDVYIGCPGSASDYYSFDGSPLKKMIEQPGLLYPGLCSLFGDNAYLNTPYLLTPLWKVSKETTDPKKDGFNFY